VLIGFFVVALPGSLTQLALGLMTSLVYFMLQLVAQPYKLPSDHYLGMVASFFLVVLFVGAMVLRLGAITDLSPIHKLLPPHLRSTLVVPSLPVTAVLISSVLGALVFAGLLVVQQAAKERRAELLRARAEKTRRLRYRESGEEVTELCALGEDRWHLFLSHAWGTGQDQMRIVKQRLLEMLPDVHVFLSSRRNSRTHAPTCFALTDACRFAALADVDDLQRRKGKGAELVAHCEHFLLFCSVGFFSSPNCMRELLCASLGSKPVIGIDGA
jgi:hypothetical protein